MASRIFPGISETMNQREKSILNFLKTKICDSVDPVTLVSFLSRHGNVPKELKERVLFLFRTGSSRHDTMRVVLDVLPEVINISVLIYALDRTGYKDIAAELFLVSRKTVIDAEIHRNRSSSSKDRTRLQTLYRNLKRMVHDSQFKNPREALRSMAKRFRSDFEVERDELKRQKLADKCVAILGVELDSHYYSVHSTVEITQQEILYEMEELIPMTTNPLITDTIVYSRQANLDACHGDFDDAENMLKTARGSALGVEQCLELVNLLYVEVYVKLWEFEATSSREVLDTLMMWGRIGLECLKNEHEETRRMWKRMFILRMVFGLLGLGNRGNVIQGYTVDRVSIKEAQNLLADVDKIWGSIEIRREMLYCIARARLNEALDLFENAKEYLERAKSLAVQGGLLEKPIIEDFINSIESQHRQTCSARSESRSSLNLDTVEEDTNAKDLLNGNTSLAVVNNSENKAKIVELQHKTLLWKPFAIPHSDVMVSFGNVPPTSHDRSERQFQEIVKGKKMKEEQNQDNDILLLKYQDEIVGTNHEDEPTNHEDTKGTCHETIQNSPLTNFEKQKHVEALALGKVPELLLNDSDVEHLDDIPASVAGTSMADNHLRMKSSQTSQFQVFVKKKTFEGETGHDIVMDDMRDPDDTDVKAVVENYQSSDSTYLKKCGSELEISSQMLHSSSAVQLESEKEHAEEKNTSPTLPVLSDGITKCFKVENDSEGMSNERIKYDIRLQLTKACEEKLEFGSVALFEDRLQPEGASFTEVSKLGQSNHGTGKTEDDLIICDDDLFG